MTYDPMTDITKSINGRRLAHCDCLVSLDGEDKEERYFGTHPWHGAWYFDRVRRRYFRILDYYTTIKVYSGWWPFRRLVREDRVISHSDFHPFETFDACVEDAVRNGANPWDLLGKYRDVLK